MVKVKSSKFNVGFCVIGVDGGGTKTAAALADTEGKIIARAVGKTAAPRFVGISMAVKNIAAVIEALLKGRKNIKILSIFIGVPDVEEEFKSRKKEIISEFKKYKKIVKIFDGKVILGSDQLAAFRSGSHSKDGVVAICGTGAAVHGWNEKTEVLINNQGWVSKGSAVWIGNRVMEAVAEDLDGRGQKTILTHLRCRPNYWNQ
jgi:N-acetylglucosamine kinase-like BadF-type ATPase